MIRKTALILLAAVLACSSATAQDLPKIAVYVTGGRDANENKVLSTFILQSLIRSGQFTAIERSDEFVAQIDREQSTQRSGAVDDNEIRRIGMQAGVQNVCVANITQAYGTFLISARIIDVETAKVAALGSAESRLRSMSDIRKVSDDIVVTMLGPQTAMTAERPPQKQTADHKRSIGARLGFGDNYLTPEAFFRMAIDENTRFALGLGVWTGKMKDDKLPGVEYNGSAVQASGFWEWHSKSPTVRGYAGPGGAIGYYICERPAHGTNPRYNGNAIGIDVGGQGGAELMASSLVFRIDARPTYYMRFWEDETTNGFKISIGTSIGFAF